MKKVFLTLTVLLLVTLLAVSCGSDGDPDGAADIARVHFAGIRTR